MSTLIAGKSTTFDHHDAGVTVEFFDADGNSRGTRTYRTQRGALRAMDNWFANRGGETR